MAGPKAEWLIWDGRFQLGFSRLARRMEISEEEVKQQIAQLDQRNKELAANSKYLQEDNDGLRDRIQQLEQASSQITQLDQQTEELAASSKYLQEDNDGLRDRIQQLEQALYQIGPLNEQVQDLTASSRDLKEENNSLNDRILQLEHESTCQDQEIRLLQKQLKERLPVQEMDLKTLNSVMRGMHVGRVAEHGQLGEEIQELKSQIQALIATRHTSGERDRDASRETSQATTEDESMLNNEHAEQRQLDAAHQDIELERVLIKAQASSGLFEDHLRYIEEVFEQYETYAVQAVMSSIQEKYRTPLGNKLDEHGKWTWQAAVEEGYMMVEAEKKTGRRSARLLARERRSY